MSIKAELQYQLKEIGYELGPFTSKDTLSIIRCLHSVVLQEKNINVAKLNDLELRANLTQHGFKVGPITNHTRAIYQRKLLEVLTHQTTNGQDDEFEIDESIHQTEYDINENSSLYSNSQNFKNTKPIIIRHDYKATSSSRNISKRNTYEESNEIRPRISTKSNEIKKDITSNKIKNDKLKIEKKSNGTFVYAIITIVVAIIVFFAYLWFEK
ncbi:unnamed protein product [Rotaria sp. Silwood1]|nr:unnamed protein product [Rotaria sp. Silwood1]CAF1136544.1 unnamed protein product [Rotaria sp. Silwood1]CAF1140544.1 unnamed protein product [Rotaria sp. Silwood1]CAF3427984.1 unnamed protein product [Rotaria sp. Silwood1]CAF3464512.1 unnamed protein product [Rotaria sp. Silwood1]